MDQAENQIFLSYASPDRDRVLPYWNWLEKQGFKLWMDSKRLMPGQNWDFEIKRAFDKSSLVVAFISKNSFERRGYVQRELKMALDKLMDKLIDDIYLIPVLLDEEIEIPEQLKSLQCISAKEVDFNERIVGAIKYQLQRLGVQRLEVQRNEELYWSSHTKKESWDGLPGYDVVLEFLDFRSDRFTNIGEIGDYIKGQLLVHLMSHREIKLTQMPGHFNYGQNKFFRTSSYDAHCGDPIIKGTILTVLYSVQWYGAGAAHPNYHFQTFAFLLEPLRLIPVLQGIFLDISQALSVLQTAVRAQLYETLVGETVDAEEISRCKDWIDRGTEGWENFHSYSFGQKGVEILIPPYQVSAYVNGPQHATVEYELIAALLSPEYLNALGLQYLIR